MFTSAYQFPAPDIADPDEIGFIAVGGDLEPQTLLHAYSTGLFPWFSEDEPIAWWCPQPRCVVDTASYKIKKSTKQTIKKNTYWLSTNMAFDEVISICAHIRSETDGTWITDDMIEAYSKMHELRFAHSIEVWSEQPIINGNINTQAELIGGLYGLKIGNVFFGESMFHTKTDASKIAFAYLNYLCAQHDVPLIDCQLENPHLMSLGAQTMRREQFLAHLQTHTDVTTITYPYSFGEFSNNRVAPASILL